MRREEIRPAAVIGQRRQRSDDRILAAAVCAVVRLQAPDRDEDGRWHAEALFDPIERGLMGPHERLTAADQGRTDTAGVELLEAEFERTLRAVEPDHGGVVGNAGERRGYH